MRTCIVLGSKSDIAQGLMPMLRADDWKVVEWRRGIGLPEAQWDLVIVAMGRVAPVGWWWEQDFQEWEECVNSNLLTPFWCLQQIWPNHNEGASVCFLAGSNPNMIMDGYSAYNTSKMALLKLVEQIDHETKDAKFFALGPGTILTKIHSPTIYAHWHNPKLDKAMVDHPDKTQQFKRVYKCLKWCVEQDKIVIGGRNICVSDDWDIHNHGLEECLREFPDLFKLRRQEQ